MLTVQIFLAVFIFILLVLVSIEDSLTGFLILLILIPLQHKEMFSLAYWDVLPIRIAFFGIILTTFYRFYLWWRRYRKKQVVIDFLKDPVLVFLIALYLVRVASIAIAPEKFAGVKLLAFYTVIVYFYILIKHLYLKHGFKFIEKSLLVYSITGTVTGFVALIQFFSYKLFDYKFGAIWEIFGQYPRVGSTFWDVNHYGAFISSIIPISAVFALAKSGKARYFWIFNTLFLSGILYLTQSRSSWLGIAVSAVILVAILFFRGFRQYAKYLFVGGSVVVIALLLYFQIFSGGVVTKYKRFMHTRLDSFDTHFILLRGAFEAYTQNPIIGGGYGNFNEVFRTTSQSEEYFFREKNIVDKRVPSHSIWGEVVAETGFLGLFFYVLTFFSILTLLFRGIFKTNGVKSLYPAALFTSITTLLIAGVFYTYNLEFFWFIAFLGMMVGLEFNKDISFNKYFDWLFGLKYLPLGFLSFFSFALIFWDLAKNKLIDWDEAIYATVSKNIIETGDYITLYWNLNYPWFEKPPLYMWVSSTAMRIFGVGEFAARFPSALFGFLSIIVVYFFAVKMFKSRFVGLISGLMLVTTAHFWYYSRLGMLDVTVAFFIMCSLFAAYVYLNNLKLRYAILSGVFTGLAVMTKAIVGLLPIAIIFIYIVYLLIFHEQKKNYLSKVFLGSIAFIVSFFVVAMPWHLAVWSKHGEAFIDVYIREHILGRGLSDAQGKTRPFFWYLEVLKVSFRGWYLVLIPSFFYTLYKVIKNSKEPAFLLIYAVVIFLFFSISNSKLVWYIIPIYPALVLINAKFLWDTLFFFTNRVVPRFKNYVNTSYLSYKNLVGASSIVFSLLLVVYILDVIPKVYYPDFNKDKVAVIEAYNEKYVDTPSSVDRLWYLLMDSPVPMFYVKGPSEPAAVNVFEDAISKAPFNKALAYISREGEVKYFQEKLGDDRVVVSYPSGAYYLMYVRSLEEYYTVKVKELKSEVLKAQLECDVELDRAECVRSIQEKQRELYDYEQILHENAPDKYLPPLNIYYN